ncbi:nuclear transport factor 2 family protein [Cribrihabitans pelagius]|uniref:nuclear transport factor 2 family protein n=1 Tax=Cribrihabitans pelagius TaxID=1765746 RepID=UPI003B599DA8
MKEQTNAEILREAYARWDACKGADLAMWDDYVTEGIKLYSMAAGAHGLDFSTARSGRDELHSYLRELTSAFEMEHWTMHETISEGDRVVGLGVTAWICKATGKRVETPVAIVCKFRGRQVCECREFYDSASLAAAVC